MSFKRKKAKPAVGMELTATISMPPGLSVEESGDAILTFLKGIVALSAATKGVWLHIYCDNIPFELEAKLQGAIDASSRPSHLKLIINEKGATP